MMAKNPKYKKLSFTIDRKYWLRGGREGNGGALCTKAGYSGDAPEDSQCCLGHLATQLGGISKERLKRWGISTLEDLVDELRRQRKGVPEAIQRVLNVNEYSFIDINDDGDLSESRREKALKERFDKIGITVKFKG